MAMRRVLMAVALFGLGHAVAAEETIDEQNDCIEGPIAQFGRYVGDWKIADEAMARDGSGWEPGKGARWIFKCVGDGTAVQDFWMPNNGGWGTNLRTYNPDTESWEIVWASTGLNGLMQISAKQQEDGSILMDILKPLQDPPRRIIFFPPDETGWRWQQEWWFESSEAWAPVYRIHASPWPEE